MNIYISKIDNKIHLSILDTDNIEEARKYTRDAGSDEVVSHFLVLNELGQQLTNVAAAAEGLTAFEEFFSQILELGIKIGMEEASGDHTTELRYLHQRLASIKKFER